MQLVSYIRNLQELSLYEFYIQMSNPVKLSLLCFLICLNGTESLFAQWTKKDSLWLQDVLSGKEKLQLNPETMKAIESGTFINQDKPASQMLMAPATSPAANLKDFSEYITRIDTGPYVPDYRKVPPSVFMKYGPGYVEEPLVFQMMRKQIREEFPRALSSNISFGDMLNRAFIPRERAKRRNAKRSDTWKLYNDLPTPDIIKKKKAFLVANPDADKDSLGFRATLIQPHLAWGNVEKNLSDFSKRIEKTHNSHLIIFPELYTSGCVMKKKDKESSLDEKAYVASYYNRVIDSMKVWSSRKQAVVMGSTVYSENGKYYNRLIAAFPDGRHLHYDKHNCFKKSGYSAGSDQLVFEYKGRKIATYICYDLRFPEWSRNKEGYDIAVYVANWPESRREAWNKLLKERAVENKATIIGVNCTGTDPNGLKYAGDSSVIGPDGILSDICAAYEEEIKTVTIRR